MSLCDGKRYEEKLWPPPRGPAVEVTMRYGVPDPRIFDRYLYRSGRLEAVENHDPRFGTTVVEFVYGPTDLPLEIASAGQKGATKFRILFTYDDEGRKISRTEILAEQDSWESDRYAYRPDGSWTHVASARGGSPESCFWIAEYGLSAAVTDARTLTTTYNSSGDIESGAFRDAEHRVVSNIAVSRKPGGAVTVRCEDRRSGVLGPLFAMLRSVAPQLAEDSSTISYSSTRSETKSGRLVTERTRAGLIEMETRLAYDRDGDLAEEVSRSTRWTIVPFLSHRAQMATNAHLKYHYDRDEFGNWARRTTINVLEGNRVVNVLDRSIVYA